MSFAALAAVSAMRASSAADKLVALAYADRHSEETGCAYPSVAWLCEFGSLNRKTVIAAVGRLEASGFLEDTGERRGSTRQIKVYRLDLGSVPVAVPSRKRDGTATGTVPKIVTEQSQKRDTETVREPIPTKASPSSGRHEPAPAPKQRARQLPVDWTPEPFADGSDLAAIVAAWRPGMLERTLSKFRDHYLGNGKRMVDWQATWRNWVRREDANGHDQRGGRRAPQRQHGGGYRDPLLALYAGGGDPGVG